MLSEKWKKPVTQGQYCTIIFVTRTVKIISTERRMLVTRARGRRKRELSSGCRASVMQDETLLETHCTTQCLRLIALHCALRGWLRGEIPC